MTDTKKTAKKVAVKKPKTNTKKVAAKKVEVKKPKATSKKVAAEKVAVKKPKTTTKKVAAEKIAVKKPTTTKKVAAEKIVVKKPKATTKKVTAEKVAVKKTKATTKKNAAEKVEVKKPKTTTKKVAAKKVSKPKAPKKTKKALAIEKENAEISEMAAKIEAVAVAMKEKAKSEKSPKTEKSKKRDEENELTDEIFNKSTVKKSRPAIKVKKITASSIKREKTIMQSTGPRKKLTAKQLREYNDKLRELRQLYQEQAKNLSNDSFSNNDIITVEDGTAAFDRQFTLGLASSEGDIIFEIDEALIRIKEKTYGVCEDCSCMIELPRLDAIAFARSCIKCQGKKERDAGIHYKPKM